TILPFRNRDLTMTAGRSSVMAWWCALTIFVSAFLLFQVQPVISKTILPWFGGSPAVWTTCVLFFQLMLLAGYAYADWLVQRVPAHRQGLIHAAVVVLAVLTLPITPGDFWKPLDGSWPAPRILLLLAAKVGAPFFLASTTGPLVQAWFSQLYPGRSPYRLYALSNVGSLAALLSYPFLFEMLLDVRTQGNLWSLGFVVFAVLIGYLSITMWRVSSEKIPEAIEPAEVGGLPVPRPAEKLAKPEPKPTDEAPPTWWLRAAWLGLAALGTTSLLSITNHLSQDIAVVPFMWVIPLSLYLLSFIICFDNERWYQRKLWGTLTILMIAWLAATLNYESVDEFAEWVQKPVTPTIENGETKSVIPLTLSDINDATVFPAVGWLGDASNKALNAVFSWTGMSARGWKADWNLHTTTEDFAEHVIVISAAWILTLFLICMVCHGELVKSKPQPKYLTNFYLFISAGGAVGGLFVALLCPLLFKLHFELALSIICGYIVGAIALANDGRNSWLKGREILQWSAAFLIVGGVLLVSKAMVEGIEDDTVAISRNFYGTVTVKTLKDDEDPSGDGLALYNGRIWHGFQYSDPARAMEPTTYYVDGTGAALSVHSHPRADEPLRVAVIGLGTGTMAVHGRKGDVFRFYDIDPKVVKVAQTYFTYLKDSDAKTEVVLGDARISMERELRTGGSQNYDVIVLDAFSGDAIPAHLLTDEAFSIYHQHLRRDMVDGQEVPMGVVVVHISNRYLDLEPVVAAIARKHGYQTRLIHTEEGFAASDTASDWVLVSQSEEFLNNERVSALGQPLEPKFELLWTDQRTSLFPILQRE
ncbi:MAG TPA: fused MFS/spermidine synthase, partial [Pirellulaceae bacterium]|nr:fused MFS/spermidine synthase [Pirellulaceae bacterium]